MAAPAQHGRVVEAADHDEAEPVEQGGPGQQDRVGLGRLPAQDQVRADEQQGQGRAVADTAGRDLVVGHQADDDVAAHRQHQGQEEQRQLDVAARLHHQPFGAVVGAALVVAGTVVPVTGPVPAGQPLYTFGTQLAIRRASARLFAVTPSSRLDV